MRTEHLQYLLSFRNGVTIEALAEELHITPQGLGAAITSLEKELGCLLLNRTKKGVFLTESAEELIECTKNFFENIERIKNKKNTELSGTIVIPFMPGSSYNTILPDMQSLFIKENKHIKIDFQPMTMQKCIQCVAENKAEIAFIVGLKEAILKELTKQNIKINIISPLYFCIEAHKDLIDPNNFDVETLKNTKIIVPTQNNTVLNNVKKFFQNNIGIEVIMEKNLNIYYNMLLNKIGYGWNTIQPNRNVFYNSEILQVPFFRDDNIFFGFIERKNFSHSVKVQRLIEFLYSNYIEPQSMESL